MAEGKHFNAGVAGRWYGPANSRVNGDLVLHFSGLGDEYEEAVRYYVRLDKLKRDVMRRNRSESGISAKVANHLGVDIDELPGLVAKLEWIQGLGGGGGPSVPGKPIPVPIPIPIPVPI